MGVFMASVAFRVTEKNNWAFIKPRIESMFKGLDGLTDNLDSNGPGYAIVSPYGDMGMLLAEIAPKVSVLIDGYAVMAMCADSDFDVLELYRCGELVERSCVGERYEEIEDLTEPDPDNWMPLLRNPDERAALEQALFEMDVFAEDNLRMLTRLTGYPIFDDGMMLAAE